MFKLDLEPLVPKLLQNKEAHIDYRKYTQEQADIIRVIVKQAKAKHPLDNVLDFACNYTQRIQELLVYVRDTCPNAINLSAEKVIFTPKNKVKKVRFAEPLTSSSNIKQVESSETSDFNTHVFSPTGLKCSTSNCGSKPIGNKKNDKISQTTSRNIKNKVEAQPRNVNKKNRVVEPIRNIDVMHHAKSAKKHKKQNIWKPMGHVFTKVGFKWKPTGRTFTIVGNSCPLTRITSANVVPPKKTTFHSVETQKLELKVYSRKPKNVKNIGSSKKAKIVESKNANHSESNHTWGSNATDIPSSSFLIMTVRFENDHIARIMRYGDYQLGNVTISRVYYVERLGHNLFSVGQFCDADLEVAFRKNTRFIRNLEGVDLISRYKNLYTISLDDMLKTSSICLLSKASKTKSWLCTVGYLISTLFRTWASMYDSCNIQFRTRYKHCFSITLYSTNRDDWDHLFQPMFDEYFDFLTFAVSPAPVADAPRAVDLANSPVSMLIDQDAPSTSIPSTQEQEHSPSISQDKVFLIKLKWIYKVKKDEFGGVLKNKARLVAQANAAHKNMTIFQMDVKTAFLNGELKEERKIQFLDQEARNEKHVSRNAKTSDRGRGRVKEDFMYQADNREINSARKEHMPYPRFTKVIIHYFIYKDNTTSMRNRISLHTTRDDTLLGTLKFVSKTEDYQKYGALIPDGMINQDIKDSKVYKTYLDYATRKVPPKKERKFKKPASPKLKTVPVSPKEPTQKGKRVKRASKKATTAPTTGVVIRDTPDTSEGTGVKPEVHDVSKEDSSDSDDNSWGDSEDENDDVHDEDDNDDDDGNDDNSGNDDDGGNDAQDSDQTNSDDDENPSFTMKDYKEEEQYEEYVLTPERDKSDDEDKMYEEEDDDVAKELYEDLNITQGLRDIDMTNAKQGGEDQQNASHELGFVQEEDSHVTLTPSMIRLKFDQKVSTLETKVSEFNQTSQFAEAISSILGIVDNYLASMLKEKVNVAVRLQSNKLKEEAEAENQELINQVDSTMKKIIKEQVKAQVSKIMPQIENYVTESLRAEVLVRLTNQPQTSYAVAASLSEFKLKKILIAALAVLKPERLKVDKARSE
uniref:Integrase, catalytic region, zinc finger, CCHC-type, peptidase aspartic, catalytic n=1 Tax=Tanacetum cinerariifolium TaxID=118510 RepID=A0A6L2M4G2_TANCI|nr:integrase, catalytic region, zinc finger, CCHC-type, peptidase aspartic, catalytic [Tanacetum cinerariifolium]